MQRTKKIVSGILSAAMLISAVTVSTYAVSSQDIPQVFAEESSSIIVSTPVPTDEWAEENGWEKAEDDHYGTIYEKTVDHIQYQLHYEKNFKIDALYGSNQPDCYYYWQISAIGTDDETMTTITIPGSVDGYPVTSVGNDYHALNYTGSFQGNKNVTELIIQDGVILLADKAFNNCSNLEKVTLPNTLMKIGDYVFTCGYGSATDEMRDAYKLNELTIPASVVRLTSTTFTGTTVETLTFKGNAPTSDNENYGSAGVYGDNFDDVETINVYSNTTGWDGYVSPHFNLKWSDLNGFNVIENGEPVEENYTITIDVPSVIYVEIGTPYQIPAVLTSNDPRYQEILWLGTNTNGISVDGVITSFGTAQGRTLYAVCGDVKKEITVMRTSAQYLPSISVDIHEVTLNAGETATVTATVTNQQRWDNTPVTWTTADPAIATVEDGIITGVAGGTTTVKACLGNFIQEIAVTVIGPEPEPEPDPEPDPDPDPTDPDVLSVMTLARYVVSTPNPVADEEHDLNRDGSVDVLDVMTLAQQIVNQI